MWRRKRGSVDFDEEIQSHIELETKRLIERGMNADEARRVALIRFGNVGQSRERFYERGRWWNDLVQDLRYAVRMLAKNRGVTAVAILTLALGMGANTAIFSILDPLLLQKLPVRDPDQLVRVDAAGSLGDIGMWESSADARFRDQDPAFSGVLNFGWATFDTVHDGISGHARSEVISGNYFDVLGLAPFQGRLSVDPRQYGSAVVLGYDYWQREFLGDARVIGKSMTVDGKSLTITGIAPRDFFGMKVGEATDLYIPTSESSKPFAMGWSLLIARLRPGVSAPQAITMSALVFAQIRKESEIPAIEQRQEMDHLVLTSAARGLSSVRVQYSLPGRILMAVAALVLLIACANVANLLLAQGSARRREIALRLAMGAGRRRLVRQLLTEGALLAFAGTAAGLLVAHWTSRWIVASLSDIQTHVVLATPLGPHVLLFSLLSAALTVVVCAVIPAFQSTRVDINQDIKTGSSGARQGSTGRLGGILVAGQVAMSVTALVAGGLLLHSLVNLETMDVGFDRDHVVAVDFDVDTAGRAPLQIKQVNDQILDRVRALPGVRSAARSSFAPVSGRMIGVNVRVAGYVGAPSEEPKAFMNGVSPGYFNTMGIALLQGRDFTPQDVAVRAHICIVNRALAHHYFGDKNPVGSVLSFIDAVGTTQIIGVVEDSKYSDVREATTDVVYLPLSASASFGAAHTIEVRAGGNPESLQTELPRVIRAIDPGARMTRVSTLRERIDDTLHVPRLITALCGIFSMLALVLTGIGLYGILAFNVSRRTGEIGVRMALGANRNAVFRLVIGQGVRLVIIGLVVGSMAAVTSAGLLQKLLFGVGRGDPATFIGIVLLLAGISTLACYLPARRAASVDPLVALRND